MPHVVTDNCHLCRFTDCVTVCPVACFHADAERTYIDPEVCIDCGACIPACPVHAIYEIIDMPDDQRPWIDINAERCRGLPSSATSRSPFPAPRNARWRWGTEVVAIKRLRRGDVVVVWKLDRGTPVLTNPGPVGSSTFSTRNAEPPS